MAARKEESFFYFIFPCRRIRKHFPMSCISVVRGRLRATAVELAKQNEKRTRTTPNTDVTHEEGSRAHQTLPSHTRPAADPFTRSHEAGCCRASTLYLCTQPSVCTHTHTRTHKHTHTSTHTQATIHRFYTHLCSHTHPHTFHACWICQVGGEEPLCCDG